MVNTDSQSKRTTDHEEIEQWAESREGKPAIVRGTKRGNSGVLRIDFGEPEQSLEEISWDQFFTIFDENNLAFLYQETTANGKPSRFNKFVAREERKEAGENSEDSQNAKKTEAKKKW